MHSNRRRTPRRSGTATSAALATTTEAVTTDGIIQRANRTEENTMLRHPIEGSLAALGLTGMAKALEEQRRQPDIEALGFEERFALLVEREVIERENKRLVRRLKFASLRQSAVVEDVDMKAPRNLDRALFQRLATGDWIIRHQNLLILGKSGIGKSWIP